MDAHPGAIATRTARRRWHLIRITGAVRAAKPDTTIEASRPAQVVTHNWRELANVRFNDHTRAGKVEWREAAFQELGAEMQALRDDYEKQVTAAPAPRARRG